MRPRGLVALGLGVALSTALAACGGGGGGSAAPAAGDPATAVPPSAALFAEGAVHPQGSVKTALQGSLSKLLGTSDPGGKIVATLDRSLRKPGLTFNRDIEPWLGERAGIFFQSFGSNPNGSVVVQTNNPKAAETTFRKGETNSGRQVRTASYRGTQIDLAGKGAHEDAFATTGSLALLGSQAGVKAALDASRGSSLADSAAFRSSTADVPSDNVFEAWADPEGIIRELVREGQIPSSEATQVRSQLGKLASQPVAVWGIASPSYLAIEASGASSAASAAQPASLLGALPSDSWLAFAVHETAQQVGRSIGSAQLGNLGPGASALQRALSQLGLDPATLSKWVGDVSGFLRGTSILGLGGALVIQTRDQAASSQTLGRIEAAFRRDVDVVVQPLGAGQTGFTLTPRGAPIQVVFTQKDGKVVIGLGQDSVSAALNPPQTLSSASAFKAAAGALGSGLAPDFYLDFQPLAGLFEIPGVIQNPQFNQVKPYLDRLDYVVAGTGQSGDRSLVRIALGVRSGGASSSGGSVSAAGLPKYAGVAP